MLYEISQGVVQHDLALQLGKQYTQLIKKYVHELYYSEGVNVHLCREPFDSTPFYTHISCEDLCHIPIVETSQTQIYKYQLIFTDAVYSVPVPLTLYKVFTSQYIDMQEEIKEALDRHFNYNCNVLYTIGSKFGSHLPYHTDAFKWRYHQNCQFHQKRALEFMTGETVEIDVGQSYTLLKPEIPHRVITTQSNIERIFLSAGQ